MASTCRILARSSPVAEVIEAEAPSGFALAELLSEGGRYFVEVDGRRLDAPREYVIGDSDRLVTVIGVPGDPGSVGYAVYSTLVAIGVGSGTAVTVGSIAAAIAAGVGFIATYGGYIAAAAALVTVATFDPPSTQQNGPPEQQNSITGVRNRFAPYAPCPVVYGKRRVFPPLAAAPFTELVGQDQYLNLLFLVSLGDCDLSALRIGDAVASSFDAIEASRHYPTAPNWPAVTDDDVAVQLDDEDWTGTPNRQHTVTTAVSSVAAAIDFNFPIGLLYTNSKGERRVARIHFRVEYRLQGTTPWLNARDTAWITTTRGDNSVLGVSGQPVPNGVGAIKASNRRDRKVLGNVTAKTANSPVAGKTTITTVESLDASTEKRYRLSKTIANTTDEWPCEPASTGVVNQWIVSNADAANYTVGQVVWLIDYGIDSDFMLSEKVNDAFRAGLKFPLGTAGTYEIRVTRTFLEQSGNTYTNNQTFLSNPTTKLIESQKYQQVMVFAMLHSYSNDQAVALPASVDATFLKVRIKANDQLSGQLEDVNVLAERKLRYWTGSAWAGPIKTRSPAWAFLDMLVNASINQRGYGESAAGTYVDLAAIKAWHDGVITSEGFSYDEAIDYPVSVYASLRRAAGVAWAGIGIPDGKFSVTLDTSANPVQMFTPRNSWGFSAVKNFVDLPHALKVQFDSEETDNKQDQIVVYADGYTSANATKFESVRLPGVTDPDQAWKLGRRMIALAKLRPETFTFQTDVENLLCKRGDPILMQHDIALWGLASGRITAKAVDTPSAGTTTVTIDNEAITAAATTYAIRVRRTDATPPVLDEFAATPVIVGNLNSQWRVTNAQAANWNLGDLVSVGKTGLVTQKLKILDIKPGANLRATIVAVEDQAGVYTAHTGTIPAYNPGITLPVDPRELAPAKPTITSVRADTGVATINPDGSRILGATVTYDFGSNYDRFAGMSAVLRYRAEPESGDEGTWAYLSKPVADGAFVVRGLEAGIDYEFQVAVSSSRGKQSPFSDVFAVTVGAPTPPQEGFEGLTVTGKPGGFDLVVDFTTREDRGVDYFEVAYHTANNRDAAEAKKYLFRPTSDLSVTNTLGAQIAVLTPITTHYFWIRWVDVFGNESPWFPDSATAGVSAMNSKLTRENQGPSVSEDPWFQDSIIGAVGDVSRPWTHLVGSDAVAATVTDGVAGTKVLRSSSSTGKHVFTSVLQPVDPTKTYAARALIRRTGSCDYSGRVCVAFYDSAGTQIIGAGSGVTGWANLGLYHDVHVADPWPDTFTRVARSFGALGQAQIPAGAKTMRIGVMLHEPGTGSTVGTMDVQDLRIDEVISSVLVEDGAITAAKLVADLVLATLIRTKSTGNRVELEGDDAELPLWIGSGTKGTAASPGSGAKLYYDAVNDKLVVRGTIEAGRIKGNDDAGLVTETAAGLPAEIGYRRGSAPSSSLGDLPWGSSDSSRSRVGAITFYHPTSVSVGAIATTRLSTVRQIVWGTVFLELHNVTAGSRTVSLKWAYRYDSGSWSYTGTAATYTLAAGEKRTVLWMPGFTPKASGWSDRLEIAAALIVDNGSADGDVKMGSSVRWETWNLGSAGRDGTTELT